MILNTPYIKPELIFCDVKINIKKWELGLTNKKLSTFIKK